MSGIEIVGLVVGLPPLIVLMRETYSFIKEHHADYRNLDPELRRLYLSLLFLESVVKYIREMVEQPHIFHEEWDAPGRKDLINGVIGDCEKDLVTLRDILSRIQDARTRNNARSILRKCIGPGKAENLRCKIREKVELLQEYFCMTIRFSDSSRATRGTAQSIDLLFPPRPAALNSIHPASGCGSNNIPDSASATSRSDSPAHLMQLSPGRYTSRSDDLDIETVQVDDSNPRQSCLAITIVRLLRNGNSVIYLKDPRDREVLTWCREQNFRIDRFDFGFDVVDECMGTTPIHQAVRKRNNSILEKMLPLTYNLEVEDRTEMHRTPLLLACSVSDADCVDLLLQAGAKASASDAYGLSGLHISVGRGPTGSEGERVARLLLGRDPNLLNHQDGFGRTPVRSAAEIGNTEMLSVLLESCQGANFRQEDNPTPLVAAIQSDISNKAAVVEILLKNGVTADLEKAKSLVTKLQSRDKGLESLLRVSGSQAETLEVWNVMFLGLPWLYMRLWTKTKQKKNGR